MMKQTTHTMRRLWSLAALGAVTLLMSGTVWAGAHFLFGSIESDQAVATPFLYVDDNGDAMHLTWYPPQRPVTFLLNQQGIPTVNNGSDLAILGAALRAWDTNGSTWAWQNGGTTPQTTAALDGVNLYTFVDPVNVLPPGVLGRTYINVALTPGNGIPAGRFVDVDIVFNGSYAWSLDGSPAPAEIELLDVAVHELGHAFGLSHHPNAGGIMFPLYTGASVGQNFPFPDDRSIVGHIYPDPAVLFRDYATISGRVFDEGGEPVFGAWITATRMDGTGDTDGMDAIGAFSLLDGRYTIPRILPGRYKVQMGPMNLQIRGQDTGSLGSYGTYGLYQFDLRTVPGQLVGSVVRRDDYPVEWYPNKPEMVADAPPVDAEAFDLVPGSSIELNFVVGFEVSSTLDEEPNNTFAEANELIYNVPLGGEINPIRAGIDPDVDYYYFVGTVADPVLVSATAVTPLQQPSPIDIRLTLYDSAFNVIAISDPPTPSAEIYHRLVESGTYYVRLEDTRGLGFGGEDYVYLIEADLVPVHALPEGTDLVSPARGPNPSHSDPLAVVGLDLVDVYGDGYGDAYIDRITIKVSNLSLRELVTADDFMPTTLDELSGFSLWRDINGDGSFNFTNGDRTDDDQHIRLRSITVIPDVDGFLVEMEPEVPFDGFGSNARLPGSEDGGRFDFFIVARTSDTIQHGENFTVVVEAGELRVIDQLTPYVVNPGMEIPLVPKLLTADIVHYVIYTNPDDVDNVGLSPYFAHFLEIGNPQALFGVNTWGAEGEDYRIKEIRLTLVDRLDFEPTIDLLDLNNTLQSGILLFQDSPASADGIFEETLDTRVPLRSDSRIVKLPDPTLEGYAQYEVILRPVEPLLVPHTDLAQDQTRGADFFIALRLSRLVRDGDLFWVQMRERGGVGPVVFTNDQSTQRVLTTESAPESHLLRISPLPEFNFESLIKEGDAPLERQSRTRPIMAVNVQDYGTHYSNLGDDAKTWFSWTWDSIRLDFLDKGTSGNFTPGDLRPIVGNNAVDVFWSEPFDGIKIFRDDSTPPANLVFPSATFDPDFDGTNGDEMRDNMDNDLDGGTDEDVGDWDLAGVNGVYDRNDDAFPLTAGNTYLMSGGFPQNYFVRRPVVSQFPGGFSVTYYMPIRRQESHECGGELGPVYPPPNGHGAVYADSWFAPHLVRADQAPLLLAGVTNLIGMSNCRGTTLNNVGTGVNFLGVPHSLGEPDPCREILEHALCTRANIIISYVHAIEFPDDDKLGGPNDGADFFVTMRTSPLLAHGDDFTLRVAAGGIAFSRYESPLFFGLTPRTSSNSVESALITSYVPIQARMSDLTSEGETVVPGAVDQGPLDLVGLDLDMGGFTDGPLLGFSPERVRGFTLEIFSPNGTPASQRVVVSSNPAVSHLNPIGPGSSSGIQMYQDSLTGFGRDGALDWNGPDPVVDIKADPVITGSGTEADPYRIEVDLDQTVPVYYDNVTSGNQFSAGNDYFIALRPSVNMPTGTRFKARLKANDIHATAPIKAIVSPEVETNVVRASVPVQILPLVFSQLEVEDSDLGPRTPAFSFNLTDDGLSQKLESLEIEAIPIQDSEWPASAAAGVFEYTLPGNPPAIWVTINYNEDVQANSVLRLTTAAGGGLNVANGRNLYQVQGDTFVLTFNGAGNSAFIVEDVREAGAPLIPRTARSEFTLSDLAPMIADSSAGLALFRDAPGEGNGVFSPNDIFVPMLTPEVDNLKVRLRFATPLPDVPDNNSGDSAGGDYFLVFRFSQNVNVGDAFALRIPRGGVVFQDAGASQATSSTAVIWANREFRPTLRFIRPQDIREPGDPSYVIRWEDTDEDADGTTIDLYYVRVGDPLQERVLILENINAIPDGLADRLTWQTAGLLRGEYRIVGVIEDNAGHIAEATASGTILLASDVANIIFTAPALGQTEDDRTAIGGRYTIRWTDGDEDTNARFRLFWDIDRTLNDPNGVGLSFIGSYIDVDDTLNRLTWELPTSLLENYSEVYVGYVETDPDLQLPIIVYAEEPILIRSVTPSVSVQFGINLFDADAVREAVAQQEIPIFYRANDIDSNGPNTARVNLYWVDESVIGPATGNVTPALLDQLAATGHLVRSPDGRTAVDLPEDAANGGLTFRWDISSVPAGTYGIIAAVTDRVVGPGELVYATSQATLVVPPLRFPTRFVGQRFESSSALAADLSGDGRTETVLMSKGGRLLVLSDDGQRLANVATLPTNDAGQVVSSLAAGDFDRSRPGVEMVVGVVGPSLLYIAGDSTVSVATKLIALDTSFVQPGVDSTPAVGDLNGDNELDVVVKLHGGKVIALAGDGLGNFSPLWEFTTAMQPTSGLDGSPAIGNVRGDDALEVVVGTADGKVLVIDTIPEFRVTTLFTAPNLANRTPQVLSSPALADVDDDGLLEIFIGMAADTRGVVYGLNGDATRAEDLSVVTRDGVPATTVLAISDAPSDPAKRSVSAVRVSPAFGDVDGDGRPDLVFANQFTLYAYSFVPGQRRANLLFSYQGPTSAVQTPFSESSPLLADLSTSEGAQEIVIGAHSNLLVLTYENGQVRMSNVLSLPAVQEKLAFDLTAPDRIATTLLIADAVADPSDQLELVLVIASNNGGLVDAIDAHWHGRPAPSLIRDTP